MPNRFNTRQRIPKGQSKKENPEKLEAWGTQEGEKQNKNTTELVWDTAMRKQIMNSSTSVLTFC